MSREAGGLRELYWLYASEIALIHRLYDRHLLYLGSNFYFNQAMSGLVNYNIAWHSSMLEA